MARVGNFMSLTLKTIEYRCSILRGGFSSFLGSMGLGQDSFIIRWDWHLIPKAGSLSLITGIIVFRYLHRRGSIWMFLAGLVMEKASLISLVPWISMPLTAYMLSTWASIGYRFFKLHNFVKLSFFSLEKQ